MSLKNQFTANRADDSAFCRRFAKQKNGQDFIPWAVQYAAVAQIYDSVEFESTVDRRDGVTGVEVTARVRLTLGEEVGPWVSATLAVTDRRNKTIPEPQADEVQNCRMRAITKALSIASGRGLSLWFGELQAPGGEG